MMFLALLLAVSFRADVSLYAPTPMPAAAKMLAVAEIQETDVVYDLGSGDGRLVILAAKLYRCRAIGIEIDAKLVDRARRNLARNDVEAEIRQGDVLKTDIKEADVILAYLMPDLLEKLKPQFAALRDGSRIVSYSKPIPGVESDQEIGVKVGDDEQTIYLYVTPLREIACRGGT